MVSLTTARELKGVGRLVTLQFDGVLIRDCDAIKAMTTASRESLELLGVLIMKVHCSNGETAPVELHIIKRFTKRRYIGRQRMVSFGVRVPECPTGRRFALLDDEFPKQNRETSYAIADDDIHLVLRSVVVIRAKAVPFTEPVVFEVGGDLDDYSLRKAGLAIVESSDGSFKVENHGD